VECQALGEDFHDRGRRIEEQVALLRAPWTGSVVDFEGAGIACGINPLRKILGIRAGSLTDWANNEGPCKVRLQQSNTDQQMSLRNLWSSSTSSRIASGS